VANFAVEGGFSIVKIGMKIGVTPGGNVVSLVASVSEYSAFEKKVNKT